MEEVNKAEAYRALGKLTDDLIYELHLARTRGVTHTDEDEKNWIRQMNQGSRDINNHIFSQTQKIAMLEYLVEAMLTAEASSKRMSVALENCRKMGAKV